MGRGALVRLACVTAVVLALAACGSDDGSKDSTGGAPVTPQGDGTDASKFFVKAEYDKQLRQRHMAPEGPASKPWLQAIQPKWVDTSRYKTAAPWNVCFTNAGFDNPWRAVGYTTMRQEVKLHPQIGKFTVVNAEGKDDKQIADLAALSAGKKCDAIIVSPNTTEALTPAVDKACASGIPVVVFDRGVDSDCPVTFIHPVGGYAFGATGAEFIVKHAKPGGKILALRILPGVDIIEHRWAAAKRVFDKAKVQVVGVEFTEADPTKTKALIGEYLERHGSLDGVWMDAGATTTAAIEAFEDAGQKVPPITGEDQQDFLEKWKASKLKAIAPTYPVFQWRTAVIAATDILSGRRVPKDWVLPQPTITSETLDSYLAPNMPPLFHATCGCQTMPGFPQRWGGS
jgi:ribose transport system substrate-binding protein